MPLDALSRKLARAALRRTRLLFKSDIPFIIPSSGTMGNNGALSGIAALPQIYPHAYVYLPANAIVAGSAAGFYYTVFSSATAGTVYNNRHDGTVSGEPVVPASPTAFLTTGPGAYTQAVEAGRQAMLYTIPAATLGANGGLQFEIGVRCTNSANAKSVGLRFGTTLVIGPSAASQTGFTVTGYLRALGATNRQISGGGTTVGGGGTQLIPTPTIFDMTAAQNANVFPNLGTATEFLVVTHVRVWQTA